MDNENMNFDVETATATGAEVVKKSATGKIIGGVAAAVVVAGGLTVGLVPSVRNSVKMLVMPTDKYYASVEKANAKKVSKSVAAAYGESSKAAIKDEYSLEYDVDVNLSDEVASLLDIGGLTQAGISADIDSKDGNTSVNAAVELMNNQLLTINSYIETSENDFTLFMKLPELSEKVISMSKKDIEDTMNEDGVNESADYILGMMDGSAFAKDNQLSESEVEDFVNKYMTFFYEDLEDIELQKGVEEKVAGEDQKYNTLTVQITPDELAAILKDVLVELKDEEIIIKNLDSMGVAKSDYTDGINELIQDLDDEMEDDLDEDKNYLEMVVYTDKTGDICGRTFTVKSEDDDDLVISYLMVDECKGEASFEYGKNKIEMESDIETKKDVTNGTVEISLSLEEVGDYTVEFTVENYEVVNKEYGYAKGDLKAEVKNFGSLACSLNSDGSSQDSKITLNVMGTEYGSVSMHYAMSDKADVATMTSDYSFNQAEEWAETLDFESFVQNLPEELNAFLYGGGSTYDEDDYNWDDEDDYNWDDEDEDEDDDDDEDDDVDGATLDYDDYSYGFSKLNITFMGANLDLPMTVAQITDVVEFEDETLEANAYTTVFDDAYTYAIGVENYEDEAVSIKDASINSISSYAGTDLVINGVTIGSSVDDLMKAFGLEKAPTTNYVTIEDTDSEFYNYIMFYVSDGVVQSVTMDYFE